MTLTVMSLEGVKAVESPLFFADIARKFTRGLIVYCGKVAPKVTKQGLAKYAQ